MVIFFFPIILGFSLSTIQYAIMLGASIKEREGDKIRGGKWDY